MTIKGGMIMSQRNSVLFVEDDAGVMAGILPDLYHHGFEPFHTSFNWRLVENLLKDEPGIDSFSALVFDLRMPIPPNKLSVFGEQFDNDRDFSPSLYFIERFINKNYPHMLDRVILYSAFFCECPPDKIKHFSFKYDKNKKDADEQLIRKIIQLRNTP